MALCSEDPIVCIDWLAMAIGDFLKDWVTLACLAVLLVILLRERARHDQRQLDTYSKAMLEYEQARHDGSARTSWTIGATHAGTAKRRPEAS